MRRLILISTLLIALAQTGPAQSCPPGDAAREAMLPLGLQNKLLAHKLVDELELEAPPTVGSDIVMLRKTLDVATQAFFHCEAGETSGAKELQAKLGTFLYTDRSKRDENSSRQDGVYGANLQVKVEPAAGLSNSVFVTLNFGISCGDDNILLLFTREKDQWRERLHWYSDKYTKPSDAFGDIFIYSVVPGSAPSNPLVTVIHGHPWCTSRWSGFEIDLLRPSTPSVSQAVLGHFAGGYDRASDQNQRIKPTTDGFTFRFWTNEAVPEKDPMQMSGPRTLRFRTTTNTLQCLSEGCKK